MIPAHPIVVIVLSMLGVSLLFLLGIDAILWGIRKL